MKPRFPASYEKNQVFSGMWEKDVKDDCYDLGPKQLNKGVAIS